MVMDLEVPLSMSQIEAANRLHRQLSHWQVTDRALHSLHDRFPGFDIDATLLKVVAVNTGVAELFEASPIDAAMLLTDSNRSALGVLSI